MTILEFTQRFGTSEACLEHLEAVRWKDGPFCPHCGSYRKIYHYSDGRRKKCADCKRIFRIITGTIFGDSPIKLLPQWFLAIYLETTLSKGIASTQLAKHAGVTQQTAWFMLQRIRNAVAQNGTGGMLGGVVEVDETYVGGKEKNKHASKRVKGAEGRSIKTKAAAFGMKERGGEVRAFNLPSTVRGSALIPLMIRNVALGTVVNADENTAYSTLGRFYHLERVNHSRGEYVRGSTHTNSIESVWAMLKRTYQGTHHWWSRKHAQLYLDAVCFRYNLTKACQTTVIGRFLSQAVHPEARLTYKALVG